MLFALYPRDHSVRFGPCERRDQVRTTGARGFSSSLTVLVPEKHRDDRGRIPIGDYRRSIPREPRSSSSRRRASPFWRRSGGGTGTGFGNTRSRMPFCSSRRKRRSSVSEPLSTGTMRAIGRPRSVTIHSRPSCASRRSSLRRAFASRTPIVFWAGRSLRFMASF